MTTYTAISKEIGWEIDPNNPIKIPAVPMAQLLRSQVGKRDELAFKEVFRIYRFAPSPVTVEEGMAMNEINGAFIEGTKLFG